VRHLIRSLQAGNRRSPQWHETLAHVEENLALSRILAIPSALLLKHIRAKMFSVLTDFDKASIQRFKQATEEKLRDVRCPEHHRPPRVRFQGESLRDIQISLSGCCAKVMEIANARIGASLHTAR
jgi:hypothetical protein